MQLMENYHQRAFLSLSRDDFRSSSFIVEKDSSSDESNRGFSAPHLKQIQPNWKNQEQISPSKISQEDCEEDLSSEISYAEDGSSKEVHICEEDLSEMEPWRVSIPSKVLDEVDVFVWDFDLSLTKMHTISRNDRAINRASIESRQPLMSSNIGDCQSEWYAGNWLLNPSYFVSVVKTLVDVYGKKVAIATHHSYRYFKTKKSQSGAKKDFDWYSDRASLKRSGEKRWFSESNNESDDSRRSAECSEPRLLAGADLVLEYLRIAFEMSGEDVKRYFHQGNVIALDCISHPGKIQHLIKILGSLGYIDSHSRTINNSLITSVKADGHRYLRVAMFDDDHQNLTSINHGLSKYISDDSSEDSYDGSYNGSKKNGDVKIRGIRLPTAIGGSYCDEEMWLRGFVAFPKSSIGQVGFTSHQLVRLKIMLEIEELDSSSSGAFIDDGYDSEEDI